MVLSKLHTKDTSSLTLNEEACGETIQDITKCSD